MYFRSVRRMTAVSTAAKAQVSLSWDGWRRLCPRTDLSKSHPNFCHLNRAEVARLFFATMKMVAMFATSKAFGALLLGWWCPGHLLLIHSFDWAPSVRPPRYQYRQHRSCSSGMCFGTKLASAYENETTVRKKKKCGKVRSFFRLVNMSSCKFDWLTLKRDCCSPMFALNFNLLSIAE